MTERHLLSTAQLRAVDTKGRGVLLEVEGT